MQIAEGLGRQGADAELAEPGSNVRANLADATVFRRRQVMDADSDLLDAADRGVSEQIVEQVVIRFRSVLAATQERADCDGPGRFQFQTEGELPEGGEAAMESRHGVAPEIISFPVIETSREGVPRLDVEGAGGEPRRAPPPRERRGGRCLLGRREVEDPPSQVVGEVGDAVAAGHRGRPRRRRRASPNLATPP